MDASNLKQITPWLWEFPTAGNMRVPARIYGDRALVAAMDDAVIRQLANVAALPGIVRAALAMPDAHSGFGFPIGGVAAFDPDQDGVICMGGVGYDIACGVRVLHTGLRREEIQPHLEALMDQFQLLVPAGVGGTGGIQLKAGELDRVLVQGARWAVKQGYGTREDLERLEDGGAMSGAVPETVSDQARKREKRQLGTLGAGNHYLEIQCVEEVLHPSAGLLGVASDDVLISVHCGSRGLGHQIGTDYIRILGEAARRHRIPIPEKELVCAPIRSSEAERYYQAMACGANYAMANRQMIVHLIREAFQRVLPGVQVRTLFEVNHNTCRREDHPVEGRSRPLYVHRKGATRAFGPESPQIQEPFRRTGQPILVGGSMGTDSYILAGRESSEDAFASTCHGSGRALSRSQALKRTPGRDVLTQLTSRGILIRTNHLKGLAEEAPAAYKDIHQVVEASTQAGLTNKFARLSPLGCLKG
ncbi:tRNA-splicing ligase RtcB [Desulfonatronum thiosulfatophilum]|uniref:tRNA-splicing ligase RtcB n=1 Tax=Desulfonatronum thiosulfatophilum TaxID=617002 RepID=A0A1G6ER15_9BACT|nr:RtcB family protein [Desulfonatronum thiosulfatophilum]SDB59712.1 tRNA-splicing ligase RtcB [Desulfonatronum thiosulfatophilum]